MFKDTDFNDFSIQNIARIAYHDMSILPG